MNREELLVKGEHQAKCWWYLGGKQKVFKAQKKTNQDGNPR